MKDFEKFEKEIFESFKKDFGIELPKDRKEMLSKIYDISNFTNKELDVYILRVPDSYYI